MPGYSRHAKIISPVDIRSPMSSQKYDFRQFQEELARLDEKAVKKPPAKPRSKKEAAAQRLASAREEFEVIRQRYQLNVGEVVAFFPEEEGITYLQQLLAAAEAKPKRPRKKAEA